MSWRILQGDVRERLADLEPQSIQTCVTSPPYWGLRDYGTAEWDGGDPDCDHAPAAASRVTRADNGLTGGKATIDAGTVQRGDCRCGAKRIDSQLGLEPTPEEYVANLVAVFREVRRVLRDDGTVWLNLGDSYASGEVGRHDRSNGYEGEYQWQTRQGDRQQRKMQTGLKSKDLCGIPWRVAFALQADGWWLRSDIIWNKSNPMPESVTDRPTRSHEFIFLLTKSARYFFDSDAIREENAEGSSGWLKSETQVEVHGNGETSQVPTGVQRVGRLDAGRNKRSVWTVTTQPYAEAHFATFPPKLIEPCILAGAPPKCCGDCGAPWERIVEREKHPDRDMEAQRLQAALRTGRTDGQVPGPEGMVDEVRTIGWRSTCDHDDDSGRSVVLDPFAGSGTTGVVALRHDRSFIGIELNESYCEMARNRIRNDAPLLNTQLEHEGEAEPAYSQPVLIADKQSSIGEQRVKGGDRFSGFNERWKNRT